MSAPDFPSRNEGHFNKARPDIALSVVINGTPTGAYWTLGHDCRPLPANKYRTLHYRDRTEYDTAYRNTFHILAKEAKLPRGLDAVIVVVDQRCRRGTTLPDGAAAAPTAKAAIDGLVDAKVIADDDPAHVLFTGFNAPFHAVEGAGRADATDRLFLTVLEVTR